MMAGRKGELVLVHEPEAACQMRLEAGGFAPQIMRLTGRPGIKRGAPRLKQLIDAGVLVLFEHFPVHQTR